MKPAILIIDVLQDYFKEGRLKDHRENLSRSINELVDLARQKSLPIIWVRQEFKDDLSDAFLDMKKRGQKITIAGTEGSKILPELHYSDGDNEIIKKRYSAFFGTNMDQLLLQLDTDTLILAGINTHACIRTTAIDAYQRDYEVVLATDCIDSYDAEHHDVSLRYLKKAISLPMNNEEIRTKLSG